MKKRLEAELISIAHRILKLNGKENIESLFKETQKLYEILSILRFVENNSNSILPKIEMPVIDQQIENQFYKVPKNIIPSKEIVNLESDTKEVFYQTEKPIATKLEKNHLVEAENLNEMNDDFIDHVYIAQLEVEIEELMADLNEIEKQIDKSSKTVYFNDLIGSKLEEPVFDRVYPATPDNNTQQTPSKKAPHGITISINDRIGFVKNLFDDNMDDYIRVLSQLATIDNFVDARSFITNMVKPDYNWQGKEEFVSRFISAVEKKYNS